MGFNKAHAHSSTQKFAAGRTKEGRAVEECSKESSGHDECPGLLIRDAIGDYYLALLVRRS